MDRGSELFRRFPRAIKELVDERVAGYFSSQVYTRLKNNCLTMDKYIDNDVGSPSINSSVNISPHIIRKGYGEFVPLFHKFFENEPLFSVGCNSDLIAERALTTLLSEDSAATRFRKNCMQWNIDHVVRYGTFAAYTFASNDNESGGMLTVKDDSAYGTDTYSQAEKPSKILAETIPIHPLNVIMDPAANFMVKPGYVGIQTDMYIADLISLADNPLYVKDNVLKAVKQLKEGISDEHWFCGETNNYTKGHAPITYLWTKLPFEGNERDNRFYAIERIAGEIIRIETNPLDSNTIPIAIGRMLPRQYDWFGNSPLCDKVAIQNLMHWMINATIESTTRLMDRIILMRKGGISQEALNNRHVTGGIVEYSGQEPDLSRLMFSPQFGNQGMRENEFLMQYMRREDQDSSAIPNFNPQAEGGPTNKTLGGAQMMASIGEMKVTQHVSNVATGFEDIARHKLTIYKNVLPDESEYKAALINDPVIYTRVSNVFNYIREAMASENRLTALINFTTKNIPEFGAVRISQYIRDWVKSSTQREDTDNYIDEEKMRQIEDQSNAPVQQQPPQPQPAA
jgi:hypothetical protein